MSTIPGNAKFGPKSINPGTGRLVQMQSKDSRQQLLPGRHAMQTLTQGDPAERSLGNYSKLTPSAVGNPVSYNDIVDMSQLGVSPAK